MKPSKLTQIIVAVICLLGIAYIYFMPGKDGKIYGRALVLALVDDADRIHSGSIWEKHDLTLEIDTSCTNNKIAKLSKCAAKKIDKAISRTKKSDKQLIILAEQDSADAILNLLTDMHYDDVDVFIIVEPNQYDLGFNASITSKLILISDIHNTNEKSIALRGLTNRIRENNWVWSTQLPNDGNGLLNHPVLSHMVAYSIGAPIDSNYKTEFDAESRWQHPIVNNDAFWQQSDFIETHSVTNVIERILKAFYAYDLNLLKQWPLQKYHAFNLLEYRDSLPEEKRGRYVSFSNLKGHKFYLDLDKYGSYGPEFVIGIDDEDNLYRLTSFYITERFNTWEDDGPKEGMLYSHSLGAFIHFRNPLPKEEELPFLQYSSILFDSIAFSNDDPYKKITGLSNKAFSVVTLNCIPCHSVHGIGGAAHHLDFSTVEPQPGFAKPLTTYSKSVLENFFFNQTETAKYIGVNPNYVDADVGKEVIAWLQAE